MPSDQDLNQRLDDLVAEYGHPDWELPWRIVSRLENRRDEDTGLVKGASCTTAEFLYALLRLFPKHARLAHLLRIVGDVSEPYEDGSLR